MARFDAEAESPERSIDSTRPRVTLNQPVYIDTSALAKRYQRETGSDQFDRFMGGLTAVSISRLTVLEFRCLLARRRRSRDLDAKSERRAAAAFIDDIARGFLEVHPLEDQHALEAYDLLIKLQQIPLRTLDALHLAIALAIGAGTIATADNTFSAAAAVLRLKVQRFGRARRDRVR